MRPKYWQLLYHFSSTKATAFSSSSLPEFYDINVSLYSKYLKTDTVSQRPAPSIICSNFTTNCQTSSILNICPLPPGSWSNISPDIKKRWILEQLSFLTVNWIVGRNYLLESMQSISTISLAKVLTILSRNYRLSPLFIQNCLFSDSNR